MKERFLSQKDFSLHPFVRVHVGFKALVNFCLFIRPSVFQTSSLVFFVKHVNVFLRELHLLYTVLIMRVITHNQFSSQLPQVTLGVVFYLEVFFNLKPIRYCS